jgi:hypothetical protein
MSKLKDITGNKYNRLTVIKLVSLKGSDGPEWECLCDCGNTKVVSGHSLKRGQTKSCGCLFKEVRKTANITHGRTGTAEYRSWNAMQQRCTNINHESYKEYGGRGITICSEWLNSFAQFFDDMGEIPEKGMSLDRIDVNKGYYKDNCRWATLHTQARNTTRNVNITIDGVTKCAVDWASYAGISDDCILQRHKRGITGLRLLSKKVQNKRFTAITHEGKTQRLNEWAVEKGVSYKQLHNLVQKKSMPIDQALRHMMKA